MDTEKIGKFIKSIREERKLTQKQFADILHVSDKAVSKWERGVSIPDILVLKEISKTFDVSVDDLLNGTPHKKKSKLVLIISIALIVIGICLGIFMITRNNQANDFVFKTIGTSCKDFTITGSAAYNKDKTSIYISSVEFCGENDETTYEKLECSLYENYNDNNRLIKNCGKDENLKLQDFLKNIKINIDNYKTMCDTFATSNVYIEISAYPKDAAIVTYKIPLTLDYNCPGLK